MIDSDGARSKRLGISDYADGATITSYPTPCWEPQGNSRDSSVIKLAPESLRESCEVTEDLRGWFRHSMRIHNSSLNISPKCLFIWSTTSGGDHSGNVQDVSVWWHPRVTKGLLFLFDNRRRNRWHTGQQRFETPMICPRSCFHDECRESRIK